MPYIKLNDRPSIFNKDDSTIYVNSIKTAGDLNFAISIMCDNFIINKGKCYATVNEIIGALECAKQELYRRVIAPYEDEKIKENGDVYTV